MLPICHSFLEFVHFEDFLLVDCAVQIMEKRERQGEKGEGVKGGKGGSASLVTLLEGGWLTGRSTSALTFQLPVICEWIIVWFAQTQMRPSKCGQARAGLSDCFFFSFQVFFFKFYVNYCFYGIVSAIRCKSTCGSIYFWEKPKIFTT